MKTRLLFIFLFLSLTFGGFAQTSIIIGTGTGSSSAVSGPIDTSNGLFKYSRHIAIYRASELNAAGVFSGSIQKISWEKGNTNSYTNNDGQYAIYIKHTTKTTHTTANVNWSTEINGATLVYSNNTQNINPGIGWQDFALSTPFAWNGNDNLEFFVDWYRPSAVPATIEWRFSLTTNANAIGPGTTTAPTTAYQNNNRPNIKLEFGSNPTADAGVTAVTAPVSPVLPSVSQPVQVTLRNFGGSILTSATINWSVNGVLQNPYPWVGSLAPAQTTAPVTIGTYTFPAGSHSLCAWTSLPSGPDFNPHNDSSCTSLSSCAPLAGNYTINSGAPASASNFVSFSAASQQLNDCGISGPVKFIVTPGSGPYNEQITLNTFPGTSSASDSVVFVGNGVTINATTSSAKPALILLNGTKRVTFRNLTLNPSATGSIDCYGFQLINSSDNCTISDCIISLPINNNNAYGILAGNSTGTAGSFTNNSQFRNNTITGGYTGIKLLGDLGMPANGNHILNNQITDFSVNGLYLLNTNNTLIQGNNISRPSLGGTFIGITLDRGNQNAIINANRIHNTNNPNTSLISPVFGIELTNCDAPAGSENVIKNNLFYNFNNIGNKIALKNLSSDGVYYYHNTIHFQNFNPATDKTIGFHQSQPASNIKFINNIINLSIAGNIKNYAYYFADLASAIETHHNIIYLDPASATTYTGFANGTDYATLAQWQMASTGPYDINSLAANPLFANPANGDLKPTAANLMHTGIPLAAVTDDFYGTLRSTTNPDPGAYEFSLPTGLAENSLNSFTVKAFPNPFSQELSLQFTATKPGEIHLTLVDALGKTVFQTAKKVEAGLQLLTPEFEKALPAGFYILEIDLNGMKTQQKVIKQ